VVLAAAAQAATAGQVARIAAPSDLGLAARLLAWLRRPWVLPAFAAASVMAVFVLTRRIIVTPERAISPQAEQAASRPQIVRLPDSPAPTVATAPAAAPAASRDEAEARPRPPSVARQQELKAALKDARRKAAREGARWATPPADKEERSARFDENDRLEAAGNRAALDGGRVAPKHLVPDDPLGGLTLGSPGKGAGKADDQPAEKKARTAGASKPARPLALAPPPAEPAPERRRVASASAESAAAAAPAHRSAAPAPAAAQPAPPRPPPAAVAEPPLADREAPVKAKKASSSYDELLRRADRAFSDGRWTDAATAYRELVRRFPADRNLAAWKARLFSCEQALRQ
jgi:hypothetical protein